MFPRFSMSRNLVELGPERLDKKVSKKLKGQRYVGLQQMLCLGEIWGIVGKGHTESK